MGGVVEGVALGSMSDLSLEPGVSPGECSTVVAYMGTARAFVAGSGSCLCSNDDQLWRTEAESSGVHTRRVVAESQSAAGLRRPWRKQGSNMRREEGKKFESIVGVYG